MPQASLANATGDLGIEGKGLKSLTFVADRRAGGMADDAAHANQARAEDVPIGSIQNLMTMIRSEVSNAVRELSATRGPSPSAPLAESETALVEHNDDGDATVDGYTHEEWHDRMEEQVPWLQQHGYVVI